jgi:segregation and condensation protein A
VPYEVQTPVFEGPFDLLLHLILREQVDIYEISLAKVVDGFLAEIEHLRSVDLEVTTEFLLIAATLVELKSRRLIPRERDLEPDEELVLWEERDLFLARLLECKTFKDAAAALADLGAAAERSFPRRTGPDERYLGLMPDLLAGVTADDLRAAFVRTAAPRPVLRVNVDHVAQIRASVRDALDGLVRELPRNAPTTFRRLTAGVTDRLEIVVRFLAVLELCKQGLVDLDQTETFGEIHVIWIGGEERDVADVTAGADVYDG